MDTVLVTGGTGHLGRDLVARLKGSYRVRVLARSPGSDPDVEWVRGDLATGEGISNALAGSQTVIHAATLSPAARRGYFVPKDLWSSPAEVDREGTARLLEGAVVAGIGHFVHVSIVGIDKPRVPYLRRKLEAENLVSSSRIPWSIARATQFHWLQDRLFGSMARLPVVPLPSNLPMEPVDTTDFADYVVQCVRSGPGGRLADFGGPEVLTFAEGFDQWQQIRRQVRTLPFPLPQAIRNGAASMFLTGAGSRRGIVTWSDWLRSHEPE